MTKQYSESEAYKQLLEVTENILASLTTEPEIMKKYSTLKKSIISKIVPTSLNHESGSEVRIRQRHHEEDKTFLFKIIGTYKSITESFIGGLTLFEQEIEGEMNNKNFAKKCSKIKKQMNVAISNLQNSLQQYSSVTMAFQSHIPSLSVAFKEDLSSLTYSTRQYQSKLDNMGLMIEVHSKMHQIILDASSKQIKRNQRELQYTDRLNYLEDTVGNIKDVKKFIQQFGLTKAKYDQFDRARKSLGKVLFDL